MRCIKSRMGVHVLDLLGGAPRVRVHGLLRLKMYTVITRVQSESHAAEALRGAPTEGLVVRAWRRIARAGERAGTRDARGGTRVGHHPRRPLPKQQPRRAAWAAGASDLRLSRTPTRPHEAAAKGS